MIRSKIKIIALLISLVMAVLPFTIAIASCCHTDNQEMSKQAAEVNHDHHLMMMDMESATDDEHDCQNDLNCHCISSAINSDSHLITATDANTQLAFYSIPSFTDLSPSQDSPPPKQA